MFAIARPTPPAPITRALTENQPLLGCRTKVTDNPGGRQNLGETCPVSVMITPYEPS